ncbi:hypothetical protein [Rhizobium lusitanum]|uniref:Uncharacterized protein n=1 Tax=Rhizobium lusitanum TaxID=293958 RepID=A0A7X0MFQ9_9HYPH|nr:hypothetical protein [Rhizobium lusitanum]MBB6487375.1 hypothetical protein [Rhizobium lusitanum]
MKKALAERDFNSIALAGETHCSICCATVSETDEALDVKIGFTKAGIGADFDFLNCVRSPKVSCNGEMATQSSPISLQVPGAEREAASMNIAQYPAARDGQY